MPEAFLLFIGFFDFLLFVGFLDFLLFMLFLDFLIYLNSFFQNFLQSYLEITDAFKRHENQ